MMNLAADTKGDPRRARILDGAMKVFLAYGFARTTMDDIARAAEVSRPTLYLQFRNKADIFRAIGASILERSLAEARAGLTIEGSFGERMMTALDRALFSLMEMVDKSAHGEEILGLENKIAADIIAEWREGLTEAVEAAVEEEAVRNGADLGQYGLTPRSLAELLLDGLEGMRLRGLCGRPAIDGARRLITVMEIVLVAATPKKD
ncbi:TetR/AcrR family transcriptional regulator [Nitratireductor sp. ZSWI3]|uniref:TetR/AcrR family transcriptional regulator n=1 Tax=Nitratireductor sp. ZSWI3 TaxID=2966359 RepID=UPI00215051F4|nr:TetR/AcrR family transcriptional regulator [Nitratireductor sp. ZSWI3]MCR4266601.1 TetR/AcrR family transcriptional regulator [Nitratireductor sp. ZSWI3]